MTLTASQLLTHLVTFSSFKHFSPFETKLPTQKGKSGEEKEEGMKKRKKSENGSDTRKERREK